MVWPSRSAESPRVGFVGLGNLGSPMAGRIESAGRLHAIWARSPAAGADLGPAVLRSSNTAALAGEVDILCVCVPDERDVREVVTPSVIAALGGGVLVVHSTVSPAACQELASMAAPFGVGVIDAPVCGGPSAARAGRLILAAGGDADDIRRCAPLFEVQSLLWRHVGPHGSGQKVKLLMNLLYSANVEIICQALTVGDELGIDRATLGTFIRTLPSEGFVGSFLATAVPVPDLVEHGRRLLAKDVAYAASLLDGVGSATNLVDLGYAAIDSLRNLEPDR